VRPTSCADADLRETTPQDLGAVLETYRHYLLAVAAGELAHDLRAKAGPSDLVQQTFLEAHKQLDKFRGATEGELAAWLRKILLRHVARLHRSHKATDKRQASREVRLADLGDRLGAAELACPAPSPSRQLIVRERDQGLERALTQLPDLYRRVIQWRNYELLPFERIGQLLGRSENAARKLWMRALKDLQALLESPDEPDN
jgi:RNA polymerase sigma-70 factor (ECF subfamily)